MNTPQNPYAPLFRTIELQLQMLTETIGHLRAALDEQDGQAPAPARVANKKAGKRRISAQGRANMVAAQRRRWAAAEKKAPAVAKKAGAGKSA